MPHRAVVLVLCGLAGCSSLHVRHEAPPDASLAAYRTFAVVPAPVDPDHPLSRDLQDPDTRRALDAAVTQDLTAKGLRPADADAADLHVSCYGTASDAANLEYWGTGGAPYQTPLLTPRATFKGQLTIDVVDARSRKLVWRGTGWGEAPRTTFSEAVADILQPFPELR